MSKAEDNSTDFQSAFVPQAMGQGRAPSDPTGLPVGFTPDDERGPSLQDQRHRFVLSGLYVARGAVQVSSIVTVASGRPYNILAGADPARIAAALVCFVPPAARPMLYGDGRAAERVVAELERNA